MSSEDFFQLIKSKLGNQLIESAIELGDVAVRVERARMLDFFKLLKLDTELDFNQLLDLTVVDWLDNRPQRFEVVYHLLSIRKLHRLRVKIWVPEEDAQVESICSLWHGANFMEREAWDMYGVTFRGHPDLRRILTYDEFQGHPLRKDYPVQGKQPRIPMRSPEVRNTAVDMQRPTLVKIGSSRKAGGVIQR